MLLREYVLLNFFVKFFRRYLLTYENMLETNYFKKEIDRTCCLEYEKTGICPRKDLCIKSHRNAELSRCIVFHHLYPDPDLFIEMLGDPKALVITDKEKENLLNAFYLDVYYMLIQFGPLDDLVIASNKVNAMSGNVFAMFREVDGAAACYLALNNQFYAGRRVRITFTPIIRLSSAVCRDGENCQSGDNCIYIHPYNPTIYTEVFPRVKRMFARPFRRRKVVVLASPQDALHGVHRKHPDD